MTLSDSLLFFAFALISINCLSNWNILCTKVSDISFEKEIVKLKESASFYEKRRIRKTAISSYNSRNFDVNNKSDAPFYEEATAAYLVESKPINSSYNAYENSGNYFSQMLEMTEEGFDMVAKARILRLHNLYRSKVTPPAADMAFMEWDEELERLAQIWANHCIFTHWTPTNKYEGSIGQNLYSGYESSGNFGMEMWFDEYYHYDVRKQQCSPNRICGHYVQMAWAKSNRLGCAKKKCGHHYRILCHYSPAVISGVQMYRIGETCSQCPAKEGSLCYENLCMTWEQCRRNPDYCKIAKCELKCQNCGRLDETMCRCQCADGWDSSDCSRQCRDENEMCGKNPGWPPISCNHTIIADHYCRKMCKRCAPISKVSTDTCCEGRQCEEGYVLNAENCSCSLLCPGPLCDSEDQSWTSSGQSWLTLSAEQLLVFLMLFFLLFSK